MSALDFDVAGAFSAYPLLFSLYVAVIGLLIGSFLNVVILRLPLIEGLLDEEDVQVADRDNLPSTLWGRSYCPHCKSKLPWYVNVPVFAWVFLRGTALCCQKKIHWRYPVVELISSGVSLLLLFFFGPSAAFLVSCALAYIGLCLVIIDFEHMLLPDKLTYSALWLGLLSSVFSVFQNSEDAIIGAIFGFLFLAIINGVFYLVSKKQGFGGGDYKLMAAIGSVCGALSVPGVVGVASVSFVFYALSFRFKDRHKPLPFGPFLILGALIWMATGPFY